MVDIKRVDKNDPLIWYRELVRYSLDSGTALGLSARREELAKDTLTKEQTSALDALDEEVITDILELDTVDAELLQDDSAKPLQSWWWHLGKIRAKTYPAELLPVHLQAVYLET
jgi:hypothetical protein